VGAWRSSRDLVSSGCGDDASPKCSRPSSRVSKEEPREAGRVVEPDAHRDDLDLFTALDEEPLRGLDPDLGHVDLEGQTDLLSKARGQVVRRGADRAGQPSGGRY